MSVRFWFPDLFVQPSGQALRHADIDMPAPPREGDVVTFDDLRPDDVFRVVSVWWSLSTGVVAEDGGVRGQVSEVAVHLDLDAELTEALKDVETVEAGPRLAGNVVSLSGKLNR